MSKRKAIVAFFVAVVLILVSMGRARADDSQLPVADAASEETNTSTDANGVGTDTTTSDGTDDGTTDDGTDENTTNTEDAEAPATATEDDVVVEPAPADPATCPNELGMKLYFTNPGPVVLEDLFTQGPGEYEITVTSCDDDPTTQIGEQANLTTNNTEWVCTTNDLPDGAEALDENGLRWTTTNCPIVKIGDQTDVTVTHAKLGNPGSLYLTAISAKLSEPIGEPDPEKTDIEALVQVKCSTLGLAEQYVLSVKQVSGPAATFDYVDGQFVTDGAPLTITGTWEDPHYGTLTKTFVTAFEPSCQAPKCAVNTNIDDNDVAMEGDLIKVTVTSEGVSPILTTLNDAMHEVHADDFTREDPYAEGLYTVAGYTIDPTTGTWMGNPSCVESFFVAAVDQPELLEQTCPNDPSRIVADLAMCAARRSSLG